MLNKKNASIILSCLGAVGVVATAIVTAKATIKAVDMLGWDVCEEIFWIDFDHRKITLDDGMECCYISTVFSPSEDWLEYQ